VGLEAPFYIDGLQVRIGASIGIALNAADPNESMTSLLERADQAMYVAKHGGKGHLIIAETPSSSDQNETLDPHTIQLTGEPAP
jgi:predicted signal transduction protein with EAL and GGDEF domain